jgi:hypothetical protein
MFVSTDPASEGAAGGRLLGVAGVEHARYANPRESARVLTSQKGNDGKVLEQARRRHDGRPQTPVVLTVGEFTPPATTTPTTGGGGPTTTKP